MSELILRDALKWATISGIALFTGGALYINIVHLPLILSESTVAKQLDSWLKMYNRAAPLQGSLATISSASALLLGYLTRNPRWYHVGIIAGAIIPFTLFVMHPLVNDPLKANEKAVQVDPSAIGNYEFSERSKKLLNTWGVLHGVRVALGATAFVLGVRLVKVLPRIVEVVA